MNKKDRIEFVKTYLAGYERLNERSKGRTSKAAWVAVRLSCSEKMAERYIAEAVAAKPNAFSDSFTTNEATISVEVGDVWGDVTEAITIKIDCRGEIHGDESIADVLIEMLEKAKANLIERRGKVTPKRLKAL